MLCFTFISEQSCIWLHFTHEIRIPLLTPHISIVCPRTRPVSPSITKTSPTVIGLSLTLLRRMFGVFLHTWKCAPHELTAPSLGACRSHSVLLLHAPVHDTRFHLSSCQRIWNGFREWGTFSMSVYCDVISISNQVAILYFSFYSLSLSHKHFCHRQKTRVTTK